MNQQRTLTLVDTDVKILKRILANQIDEYIKESYTMIKCKSFRAFKHDLVSVHQSLGYTTWAKLRIKSHDLLNNCSKSFRQRVTLILIQSLSTVVIHGTCQRVYKTSPQLTSNLVAKRWKVTVKSVGCARLLATPLPGIFQARVLEWVAISFSRGSSQPRVRTCVSHIVGRRFTIGANGDFPKRSGKNKDVHSQQSCST